MSTVRFPAFKLATPEKLGWGEDSRFLVEKVSVALWTIHLVCSYTKTCFRGKSYSINQTLPKFTHCPAATRGKKSWQNISAWQKPDVQWCAYTHQNVTPKTHRGQESTAQRCMGSFQSSLDVCFFLFFFFRMNPFLWQEKGGHSTTHASEHHPAEATSEGSVMGRI